MIRTSAVMVLLLTGITGFVYPLVVAGIAGVFFPDQAGGSLIRENGAVVGSSLIGESSSFEDPKYFWPRPSATVGFPYNPAASSGSNYGPLSRALRTRMEARRQALHNADPGNRAEIPIDLLTASASGLDPHISPASAEYQAPRVARVRGMNIAGVRALIAAHTMPRQWGVLGEPRVNVVTLNRALDRK